MIRNLIVSVLFFNVFCVAAQTPPPSVTDTTAIARSFVEYVSHVDTTKNIHYGIGRYEPEGFVFALDDTGQWRFATSSDNTKKGYPHPFAPIYLKVQQEERVRFYSLDDHQDIDLYRFLSLPSARLVVMQGRYSFHIYDIETEVLSNRITPAMQQYEREDAISGTLSGFSFFDGEQFLFGHIQAYGIFCYAISNPAQPKELLRLALSEDKNGVYYHNKGEYHLFLHPKGKGLWDILLARSDVKSESKNISRLYARFKEIRYVLKDAPISLNKRGKPKVDISADGVVRVKRKNRKEWQFNLVTGASK